MSYRDSRPLFGTWQVGRRLHPRLPAPPGLSCEIARVDVVVPVRDISIGGMALWTPGPLPVLAVYDFTLNWRDQSVTCRGRVAYSIAWYRPEWLTGIAFAPSAETPELDRLLEALESGSP